MTVIDGNEGDCNVVDYCQKPLVDDGTGKLVYDEVAWRRSIIDTGPSGTKPGANKRIGPNITNTLVGVIDNLRFPALATDTDWGPVPFVNELQV